MKNQHYDRRDFLRTMGLGAVSLALSKLAPGADAPAEPMQAAPAQAAAEAAMPDVKAGGTLENLQAAFNGESNAHVRYQAFAKKADAEGYKQAANLFRAASAAEEVHLKNHAEVIKLMGAEPKADIKAPEVKSTRENLEAAVKGEDYERVKMYPAFIELAKKDGNRDAVRTFTYAKNAETEHYKLFSEALKNLNDWKDPKLEFFVCPTCGFTTTKLDFKTGKCPVCSTPKEKFMRIK